MDPKQKQAAPVKLIKARVRPNNRYGSAIAGQVIEIAEHEMRLVPHCLVSLDDEKREQEAVDQVPSPTEKSRQELEGYRKMYRDQHEQLKKNEAERSARRSIQAAEEAKKLAGE